MAAYVEFGEAMVMGAPIYARLPRVSQELTDTSSSVATTITANSGEIATVTAVGTDLMVMIGPNPEASAEGGGQHVFLPAGTTRNFGPMKDLDKIAAIDT